ncbi:MAG: extracellular solute-binding protein [Gorillibacterium sp.]|nr:extracellular solute-binding protein [Gorillibacterium sp.]
MKTKKAFKMSLILILVTIVFLTGCSKKNNNVEPTASAVPSPTASASEPVATSFQLGSEPLNFSFYGNYDWWVTDEWGNDPTTKWIQENFKITVKPVQSGGTAQQKLNTMIVSNELPNVIMSEGADFEKLRAAGQLLPLDDYLDKYPNLMKYAGDKTLNLLRSEDGKLYGFPNWYTSSPNGNSGYLVNKKIYKELGAPKLETFTDLESYLKLVKEKYPDVIPFEADISAQGIFLFAAGKEEGYSTRYIDEKAVPRGDQLTSLFLDPTFNATIKEASKLFRQKLITQDTFTQKSDQVYEKIKNGRVAVFASGDAVNSNIKDGNNLLSEKDPDAGYMAIWPIHEDAVSKDKVFTNSYSTTGWNLVSITKGTENPEAIFAYLDWMTGAEGQATTSFGPKGRYWDELTAEGAPILNEKWNTTPQTEKDKEIMGKFNWAGNTTLTDVTKASIQAKLPEDKRDWSTTQQIDVIFKTSQDMTVFNNFKLAADSEAGIANAAVKAIFEEYVAKAVYAKNDAEVDAILKEANDAAMAQGYEAMLKAKTEAWQANIKKASGQ